MRGFEWIRRKRRPAAASQSEPGQEHAENDRKRVNRRPQHERERAGPDHLGAQRAKARERDGEIHWPGVRRPSRRFPVLAEGCFVSYEPGQRQAGERNRQVDDGGHITRGSHVVNSQQIKSRQQASEDAAGDVPAVKNPHQEAACGVVSIQREIAGRVAPIMSVGGSRQIAEATLRSRIPGSPWPMLAV